jgi:ketosteroid isomerase-like protein
MKKSFVAFSLALTAVASVTALAFAQNTPPSDAETVAAITQLENDAVKADLAQDSSFYDHYLADAWTGGTSRGTWDTKQSLVADMKDTTNNKTTSESIRDVKVHVYGDTAIASYTSTYDSMIKGQHYARTVISTDTFMRQNGEWKQIAGHSSQAAK